jgi:hypothetical protein
MLFACARPSVKTAEFGDKKITDKVLIATEHSEFKDALLEKIKTSLSKQPVYVRIIDVNDIKSEPARYYDAVLIVNTCLAWNRNQTVTKYVEKTSEKEKLIVLTTMDKNCGTNLLAVDAISSASNPALVDDLAEKIINKIQSRLDNGKKKG